jgi:uncharacterized membrane protein
VEVHQRTGYGDVEECRGENLKEERIVKDYLKRIDSELFGLDPKARAAALDEIRAHIRERSMDAVKDRGLDRPDERTIREVLKDFGNPFEVAAEYRKDLRIKTPASIKVVLSYCIFIAILDLLIMAFYFRDAYWEATWQYTDNIYFWGAIAIGFVYGTLGIALIKLSILQMKDTSRISYLGNLTLIIAVFSIVMAILGGILQQVVEWELGYDLWFYPNNLVIGAIAIVPVLVFLASLPIFDKFRRILEAKEEDPGRILRLRKRSQALAFSAGVVFLILIGLLSVGFFDHDMNREDQTFVKNELLDSFDVRPGVRIEVWNGYGPYMDTVHKIIYEKDGVLMNESIYPNLIDALDWILQNSTTGQKVFSWWDHGYPIEGYTGLDSVIDRPAKYLQQTIANPSTIKAWADNETPIRDVASGFIAIDPSQTISIMDQYGADFFLTEIRDQYSIMYAFILAAGLETGDYIEWQQASLTDLGKNTVIHRIWSGEEIPGLEVVYSDLEVKVLKRV